MIVLGGLLGGAGSVVDGVRHAVDRYGQPATAHAVEVTSGELGDRAEVIGAVTMAVAMVTAGDD